jgi:tRNA U34 5-methylaminomethyl-2-thiouridine-forming methyltransferase MnmC
LKREIITTLDGSTTIHLPDWDECYHSKHGAIQEAYHVFIQNGLNLIENKTISILEIGFGSGRIATILENIDFKGTYLGIDIQPNAIDFVEKLEIEDSKYKFLLLDELKTENLNMEHNFDLVIFSLSL